MNAAAKYSALFVTLVVLIMTGEFVVHGVRADSRDSRRITDRELTVNVLDPDEHISGSASVYRRLPRDLLRATRGVLVLTDKRMIFVGLRPRDLIASADAPPTFDERSFPLDTIETVGSGRALLGLSSGIVIHTPDETVRFAVQGSSKPDALKLVEVMTRREAGAHSARITQRSLGSAADAEWARSVAAWRQGQYYTVRRGDALGSIATRWNTTPEHLKRLNGIPALTIRVGQSLLVRQAM